MSLFSNLIYIRDLFFLKCHLLCYVYYFSYFMKSQDRFVTRYVIFDKIKEKFPCATNKFADIFFFFFIFFYLIIFMCFTCFMEGKGHSNLKHSAHTISVISTM